MIHHHDFKLDLLRSNCGILETDSPESIIEKVRSGLERVEMNPDQDSPVLLHLLGVQDAGTAPALSNPEAVKAKTFEVFRQVSIKVSLERPLVLTLEDLHWVDKISEEFFGRPECDTRPGGTAMTDFPLPLDAEARAYASIGRFLQMWSLMECELNDAIGEALDLSSMQTEILCNNIQLRNRLHILRTLAAISALDEEEKRRIDKRLNQIGEYISHRNMVAHMPFVPSETSNGVQFVGAKARGALRFFVEDWSVEKFGEIDKTIAGFMGELASLRKTLEIPGDAIREYAASYYAKTDAGSGI